MKHRIPHSTGLRAGARRGSVLLEFALVSLALYLVLAAMLGLGRWLAVAQSTQSVAQVAAREFALYPLPAETTFAEALADPGFRGAVYDADFLVADLAVNPPGPALNAFFAAMPTVNRALRPLMITSTVDVGGTRRQLLHMPGMIVDSATSPSGLTVVVPRIDARDPNSGGESLITIVPVIEEIGPGSFSVDSPERGLVAIRVNVPYQSAALTAYVPNATGPPRPILAVDPSGGGYEIVGPGPGPEGAGPYAGTYGLGESLALGRSIRPFRRLVVAQAMFRREVFL